MNEQSTMNIAISINDDFIMPARVMLFSMFSRTKTKINLYLLYNELSEQNRSLIKKETEFYGNKYIEIYIDKIMFQNASLCGNGMLSIETYYRIMLPYITDVDKVLWLDADIIVNNDIRFLYEQDITEKYIGAVIDIGEEKGKRKEIKRALNIETQIYFNAGVLLINTKKIRDEIPKEEFFLAIQNYAPILKCADQDILNLMLGREMLLLDYKFNNLYHFDKEKSATIPEATIIHYYWKKPWNLDYCGYGERYFWENAIKCGYSSEHRKWLIIRIIKAKKELWGERWQAVKRKVLKDRK